MVVGKEESLRFRGKCSIFHLWFSEICKQLRKRLGSVRMHVYLVLLG